MRLTLEELQRLFNNGTLSRERNEFLIMDKGWFGLHTSQDYSFSASAEEIAWDYLKSLGIAVEGA